MALNVQGIAYMNSSAYFWVMAERIFKKLKSYSLNSFPCFSSLPSF